MALSCFACCVFHIISIPFNCSDTALRVAKFMVGAKVINIVFSHVCFVFRISRRHSSLGSLAFFNLGNRAEISHMNPRQNWSGNKASQVNWVHVERPLVPFSCLTRTSQSMHFGRTNIRWHAHEL